MKLLLVLLCCGGWGWGCAGHKHQPQCSVMSDVKIVLQSRYNQSGHWQSQVDLKQGGREFNKADPWTVDVQQVSSDCDEDQFALHTTIFLTAPTSSVKALHFVPSGYELVDAVGVVKRSTAPQSYADATADCHRDGASILLVDSKAKLDFVNKFVDNPAVFAGAANDRDVWAGAELRGGVWKSVRGVPVTDIPLFAWHSGRPIDGYCTVFSKPLQGHWDTPSCSIPTHKLSYICEKPRQ